MSESLSTTSSATFRSILNAALDNYCKQTGIDLTNHSSANRFRTCNTSEDTLRMFQDRETAFKDYRNKNRKLINCLRPIVQVVHAFARVLGEVAGLVSPGYRPRSCLIIIIMSLYSPTRYHSHRQKQSSSASMFSLQYVPLVCSVV